MFFSRHVCYFMKFIETGSVINAAEALYITPAAIRNSLAILENYYGRKLLKRKRAGLSPTDEGKRLYDELLPTYYSAMNSMNRYRIKNSPDNNLSLCFEGFYYPNLPTIVNNVMKNFNKQIELIQSSHSCLEQLKNDNCDMAIYSSFEDASYQKQDFCKAHISQEKIGAIISKELLSKYGSVHNAITKTKLIQRNCFLSLPLFNKIKNKIQSEGIAVRFLGMPEFADMLSLVQEGAGVSLITGSVFKHLPIYKSKLVFVDHPFSSSLTISRDIFFQKKDLNRLSDIINFITKQDNLINEN